MVSESKYFRADYERWDRERELRGGATQAGADMLEFREQTAAEHTRGYPNDPDAQPAQLKRELDQMWRYASDRAMPETKWESGCGGPPRHVYCGQCGGVSQDQRCTVCGCAAPGQP